MRRYTKVHVPGRPYAPVGEQHKNWKGDDVSYKALHDYIKYYKPKPAECQDCNQVKPLDLANISQEYKRDLDDWEWLCRSCHMKKDGRTERLLALLRSRPKRLAKCSRAIVARGICMQQYNYERRVGNKYEGQWAKRTDRAQKCKECSSVVL